MSDASVSKEKRAPRSERIHLESAVRIRVAPPARRGASSSDEIADPIRRSTRARGGHDLDGAA